MSQNFAQAPFKMDYEKMREPHLQVQEKPTKSKLSPNAREFVPQNKIDNTNHLQNSFENLQINSSASVIRQEQQQQSHYNHVHQHQQQQQQQQQQFSHNLTFEHKQQQQNCIPAQSQQQHLYNQHQYQSKTVNQKSSSLQERLYRSNHQQQQQQQQQQLPPQQYSIQIQQQQQQQNMPSLRNKQSSSSFSQNKTNMYVSVHADQQQYYNNHHQQQQNNHQYQPQESLGSSSTVNDSETSQNTLSDRTEDETFAINYIGEIVECLNSDPGSFDTISPRVLTVFSDFSDNEYVLCNVMEIIFDQSIAEQNFRYMGAKLYGLLDSINPTKDSTFRNLLKLKLDYHQGEVQKYLQNENVKLRGTTLFLAELYMQLRNNGSRVPEIAQNIIFTMRQLLQKQTPENVKCICLTLKLAGYDLEIDCRNDLLQIINDLRNIKMDVSTNRILENTLSLHKNNWGRNETINQVTYPAAAVRYSNEPVFYGPDGQILTEEENSFLEANIPCDINDGDPDFDEFDLEAGMDAEMEKDYNEFLKNTMNNSC